MIRNSSPWARMLLILGMGVVLFALLDMFVLLPSIPPVPRQALLFFYHSFLLLTIVLSFPIMRLKFSNDEPAKGKAALSGLVLHFALSIGLIIAYYIWLFKGVQAEVWIAMTAYVTSFLIYVIYASSMD